MRIPGLSCAKIVLGEKNCGIRSAHVGDMQRHYSAGKDESDISLMSGGKKRLRMQQNRSCAKEEASNTCKCHNVE